MTFGLCCSQPACRPHPASLPVRVPPVEGLLRASFGCYALRFATVAVIGSGWLLSSNEILPMLGTLGRTPGPRGGPRRPAGAPQDADVVVSAAGPGRGASRAGRGSAPPPRRFAALAGTSLCHNFA